MGVKSREQLWWRDRRAVSAALAVTGALMNLFVACGGTNGREGLPGTGDDASMPVVEASAMETGVNTTAPIVEAGVDADSSDLDAGIEYADAARLRGYAEAAVPIGADGAVTVVEAAPPPGSDWPVCASDMLGASGHGVPDDSGACSTHAWTITYRSGDAGGKTCDQCMRFAQCGAGITTGQNGVLPPCSDVREAGTAAQGHGAGRSLFELCAALFNCVSTSSCAGGGSLDRNATVNNCYCGSVKGAACLQPDAAPNGVCKSQIEEAVQAGPSTSASSIINNLTDMSNPVGLPGSHAGTEVMALYNCALTNGCDMCFSHGAGDGG
jgi:hypothetical protein